MVAFAEGDEGDFGRGTDACGEDGFAQTLVDIEVLPVFLIKASVLFVPVTRGCPTKQAGLCGMGVTREGEGYVATDDVEVPVGGVVAEEDDEETLRAVDGGVELAGGGKMVAGGDILDTGDGNRVAPSAEECVAVEQHLPAHALFKLDDVL